MSIVSMSMSLNYSPPSSLDRCATRSKVVEVLKAQASISIFDGNGFQMSSNFRNQFPLRCLLTLLHDAWFLAEETLALLAVEAICALATCTTENSLGSGIRPNMQGRTMQRQYEATSASAALLLSSLTEGSPEWDLLPPSLKEGAATALAARLLSEARQDKDENCEIENSTYRRREGHGLDLVQPLFDKECLFHLFGP